MRTFEEEYVYATWISIMNKNVNSHNQHILYKKQVWNPHREKRVNVINCNTVDILDSRKFESYFLTLCAHIDI